MENMYTRDHRSGVILEACRDVDRLNALDDILLKGCTRVLSCRLFARNYKHKLRFCGLDYCDEAEFNKARHTPDFIAVPYEQEEHSAIYFYVREHNYEHKTPGFFLVSREDWDTYVWAMGYKRLRVRGMTKAFTRENVEKALADTAQTLTLWANGWLWSLSIVHEGERAYVFELFEEEEEAMRYGKELLKLEYGIEELYPESRFKVHVTYELVA